MVWDWRTGALVAEVRPEHRAVYAEESPDRSLLLTVTSPYRRSMAQVWDRGSQTEVATIQKEQERIAEARFLVDGKWVLTRYFRNASPSTWESRTGEELFVLEGHSRSVLAIAVSKGGQGAATGGADRTVGHWNANTGRQEAVLAGHPGPPLGVEYSPVGGLVAAYGSSWATVWRVGLESPPAASK